MESPNFYAAPQATLGPDPAATATGSVPAKAVEELLAIRTVLLVFGIVAALACTVVVGILAWQFARQGNGLRLIVLVTAALFAAPAMLATRASAAIEVLAKDPSAPQLVGVVQRLRDFWRLAGLITAAALLVYVVTRFLMGIFLSAT